MQNLESTFTALEGIHRGSAERFAATLQNKTLIPQSQVKEEYERLLLKYETELDMYVSTKLAANSASRFDTVKQLILSRPLILVLTLAISAILVLAAFADAISSLARRIAGWVTGEG